MSCTSLESISAVCNNLVPSAPLRVFTPGEHGKGNLRGRVFGECNTASRLREFSVDPLSKLVTSQMTIEPKLGMVNHEVRFDRIKLNLTSLGNFTGGGLSIGNLGLRV